MFQEPEKYYLIVRLKQMDKFEQKLIKKIYVYETKRNFFSSLIRFIFLIFLVLITALLFQITYLNLAEGFAFDNLEIIMADIDMFKKYFVSETIYIIQKVPGYEIFSILFVTTLLLIWGFLLFKFWKKSLQKNGDILNYWKKKLVVKRT